MRPLLLIISLIITSLSFAQSNNTINGRIMDLDNPREPLIHAEVAIKETGRKTLTNEKGEFKFSNLEEATYTLVFSFIGYESEEHKVDISSSKKPFISLHLKPSSISFNELMSTLATAENEEKNKSFANNQ